MARRTHRKLFPTLSSSNQTQNCPEFCDPCPYNCYSFPDYYFPPPSSLSSSPPPSISSSSHSTPSSHIPSYFIILASLFSLLFILIGLYVIKTKCYPNWSPHASSSSSPSDASDQEFLEMDHHHHHHHHHHPIWLITTMGLHQSIINSITVCKYKRGEGLIEGTECSVCLNEFHEDETLRLLPKCSHAFHIPCIDTWLRSHTNCPLCRAGIVISNSNAVEPEDSGNSRTNIQEIQSENIPTNGVDELSNNEDVSVIIVNGVSGNRAETGEEHAKEDDGDDDDEGVLNDERRIIINKIRSMSMDARVDHKREGDYSMFKTKCLHVSPIAMKRSFSCSGRILSARGYRNLITSLPY